MKKSISSNMETLNFSLWISSILFEVSKLGLSYLQGTKGQAAVREIKDKQKWVIYHLHPISREPATG